ncbi:MAG TPA: transcriptional repressor [Oligoflexia bacterium]|nr:transcriptional repressor [Oligoflexia bacterium]HMP26607.1 transcriptional repressor [Oligoflexia bacterium]
MRTHLYRKQIFSLLRRKHFMSIAEIHKAIPEADYSTVFRNVKQLLAAGEVRRVFLDRKSFVYELAEHQHDHFICNDCGQVESFHLPVDKRVFKGRQVNEITVRGTCCDCQAG